MIMKSKGPAAVGFAVLAVWLVGSVPAWAEEEPAAVTPPVTVVKGGGVAETYRRQGAGFEAYGPDGKAPAPSEPVAQRALRAIAQAPDIELVALDTTPGQAANLSCGSTCVGGYPVAGRVPVQSAPSLTFVRETVADWLMAKPAPQVACEPHFQHAVKYSHDSYRYEVLLAYNCSQYRILRGGLPVSEGTAVDPPGKDGVEALLKAG